MKYKGIVIILILAITLFSGCTNNPSDFNFPVGGKLYCQLFADCKKEEKKVEIPDVVVIKDVKVLPIVGNEVRPNREIEIIVTLENRDENKQVTLEKVGINPGIFTCERCSSSGKLNPGQIKTFSFTLTSPENKGTMTYPAHLEVIVKYDYTSSRMVTITYTKEDTVKEYIEGGKKLPIHITSVPSDGPVELYIDISKIQQPLIIGQGREYNFYLEVRNKGSGDIDKIEGWKLTIELQDMSFTDCSEEFSCSGSKASNNEEIALRGTIPKKYYFSFKPDSSKIESELNSVLTVTKQINAYATYTYRISKPIDLLVSPRAGI